MKEKIAVIGGDLRTSNLAKMFEEDGNEVSVYGMEKSDEIMEDDKLKKCKTINEAIENADIVIGSVPFAKDNDKMYAIFSDKDIKINDLAKKKYKGKIFIAGGIDQKSYDILSQKYEKVIDVMKREDLVILNTIATAEGTIELAIKNTDKILSGSKVLVLGFGRVGKVVASKFKALDTEVTCAARKPTDLAWMKAFGYECLDINHLGKE